MHLGRFNAAVETLDTYFRTSGVEPGLQGVIDSLNECASSRTPESLSTFRSKYAALTKAVEATPSSFLLPSYMQFFQDLHLSAWIGSSLAKRITDAVASQALSPEETVALLTVLQGELKAVTEDISKLDGALASREVEYEELDPDSAEFGVSLPKATVGESTRDLAFELTHVERLFTSFNEMAGKGTDPPKIRTIASSWWQIFIELDATQVAAYSFALERIIALLKNSYEIRAIQKSLSEKKGFIPDGFADQLGEQIASGMKAGISQLAADLRKEYANNANEERTNELQVQLKLELTHLAKRLTEGAEVELQIGAPRSLCRFLMMPLMSRRLRIKRCWPAIKSRCKR